MSRKFFMWVSWSLESLLKFSTSFWLDEGLVLSHQNSCTSPFTTSMRFIPKCVKLPMKSQTCVWHESSCSLLEQYLRSDLISKPTSLNVGLRIQRAFVLLFTIDYDNRWWVALRSFEHDLFPIVLNASTKLLTTWEVGSELFIIFILNSFLTTVINLEFNNDINNLHLYPSHLESK